MVMDLICFRYVEFFERLIKAFRLFLSRPMVMWRK